jgi:hypothetical protein
MHRCQVWKVRHTNSVSPAENAAPIVHKPVWLLTDPLRSCLHGDRHLSSAVRRRLLADKGERYTCR